MTAISNYLSYLRDVSYKIATRTGFEKVGKLHQRKIAKAQKSIIQIKEKLNDVTRSEERRVGKECSS